MERLGVAISQQDLMHVMNAIDVDHSGTIDLHEFNRVLKSAPAKPGPGPQAKPKVSKVGAVGFESNPTETQTNTPLPAPSRLVLATAFLRWAEEKGGRRTSGTRGWAQG